jgi:hypothetical protein
MTPEIFFGLPQKLTFELISDDCSKPLRVERPVRVAGNATHYRSGNIIEVVEDDCGGAKDDGGGGAKYSDTD